MSTVAKLYIRKLGSLWADKIHPALTIHLTLFWNKNTCIKIANEKTLFCMKELKRPCRESLSFVLEMTIAPRAIMQNWQWPAERSGFFHDESGPLDFVQHMLLTHAERLSKAVVQKQKYAKLTPPQERFDWFVLAVVNSKGHAASDSLKCKHVEGAKICARKA